MRFAWPAHRLTQIEQRESARGRVWAFGKNCIQRGPRDDDGPIARQTPAMIANDGPATIRGPF